MVYSRTRRALSRVVWCTEIETQFGFFYRNLKSNRLGKILGSVSVRGQKMGAYAMKRVAAGAHLSTLWLFEPAICPDDRTDYCLGQSIFITGGISVFVLQLLSRKT